MRLQFLCLLWSVIGHFGLASDETKEIDMKNSQVLSKLPKDMPEEDRLAIRDWLVELKTKLREREKNEQKNEQKNQKMFFENQKIWKKENNQLCVNLTLFKDKYGTVARGVKTRDWILEKERLYFPVWLSLLNIGRFVKWCIALYTVDARYINKLRDELDDQGIDYKQFAAEIDSVFEKAAKSVHKVDNIEKPKDDQEIREFCNHFFPSHDKCSHFACLFVINSNNEAKIADPVSTVIPKLDDTRSVDLKMSTISTSAEVTNFCIVIAYANEKGSDIETLHDEIKSEIENVQEFKRVHGVVIGSIELPENPLKLDDHDIRTKNHLPSFFVRLGVEITLGVGTHQQIMANHKTYKDLKDAISNKLKSKPKLNKATILFVDPYYLTTDLPNRDKSATVTLPAQDVTAKDSTTFPTRFFICISNVQSSDSELKTKFDSVKQLIEGAIKTSNIEHIMIGSNFVTANDQISPSNGIPEQLTVPGMYFHVGVNLDTSAKESSDYSKYTALKSAITTKIKPEEKDGKNEYDVVITDDPVKPVEPNQ